MGRAGDRLLVTARQVRAGEISAVGADVAHWMSSQSESVGLRRDFARHYSAPPSSFGRLTAAPLDDALAERVFDRRGLNPRDQHLLERRHALWTAGFEGAYVALTDDGEPAYLSWFIPHFQADKVRDYWGSMFPFGPDTLIGEGAWVVPKFRGHGLMGLGHFVLTEAAKQDAGPDVRYVTVYTEANNRGAAIGSYRAGYEVFVRRIESWRLGKRFVRFEPASFADFAVFDGVEQTH